MLHTQDKLCKNPVVYIHTSFVQKLWRMLLLTEVNFSDDWTLILQVQTFSFKYVPGNPLWFIPLSSQEDNTEHTDK